MPRFPKFLVSAFFSVIFLLVGSLSPSPVSSQSIPSAPSLLPGTAISNSQINLSWQDVSGEAGYLVYRSINQNFFNATIQQTVADVVTLSDTGLSSGTTYYYQVYACNAAGCAPSNIIQATTQGAGGNVQGADDNNPLTLVGSSPEAFSAIPSACAVNLSWNQNPSAQGTFRLIRKFSLGGPQEFDALASTPTDVSYSCVDNNFNQSVLSDGGCGASIWSGYDPDTAISYQIEFCPQEGQCSSAIPSSPPNVSTIALPTAPAKPLPNALFSWKPQGVIAFGTSGNKQITLNFKSDPAGPLSAKFKNYGGYIIDRSSTGKNSDAGFPKFISASILPPGDTIKGIFTYSSEGTLDANTSYTYTIKLYESDQYCKPDSNDRQYNASQPVMVTVPTMPTSFKGEAVQNGQALSINLSWVKPAGGEKFTVIRSANAGFSNPTTLVTDTADNEVTDSNDIKSFSTLYYKVTACSNSGGCSDFAVTSVATKAVISGVSASVQSKTNTTASVLVNWDSQGNFTRITVTRTDITPGSTAVTLTCPNSLKNYCIDTNVPLGKVYNYQVTGVSPSPVQNPPPYRLSLNVGSINGWAFGFAPPAADANSTKGIGWIRLSNSSVSSIWGDSTYTTIDTQAYGIFIDKDTGLLSGWAWSGLDCAANENRPAGTACGYGWLNFSLSESDSTNCPDRHRQVSGQPCQGSVDLNPTYLNTSAPNPNFGKVDGWAKFTAADSSKGAWDGWVSLRGTANSGDKWGLCYGDVSDQLKNGATCAKNGSDTNSKLSGWAWGNDVTGWINFGTMLPPVLNTVTSASDGKSVTLKWSNGMDYSRVEVWRSQPELYPACASNPTDLVSCRYKPLPPSNVSMGPGATSTSPTMQSADKSGVVTGLSTSTTYGFFIRAYTQ